MGNLKSAKKFLTKACNISTENRELTLLNLCAIHSQLNDHVGARTIAKQAVLEISNKIVEVTSKSNKKMKKFKSSIKLLSIAYYNLGV